MYENTEHPKDSFASVIYGKDKCCLLKFLRPYQIKAYQWAPKAAFEMSDPAYHLGLIQVAFCTSPIQSLCAQFDMRSLESQHSSTALQQYHVCNIDTSINDICTMYLSHKCPSLLAFEIGISFNIYKTTFTVIAPWKLLPYSVTCRWEKLTSAELPLP